MLRVISALFMILLSAGLIGAQIRSVYTSLDEKHCKSLKRNPAEPNVIYNGMCSGVGGYQLNIMASDEHQWIELVTPSRKSFGVGMQSASYNFLGTKAEWRVKAGKPIALIVRYNLIGPEGNNVTQSYLVVSKISRSSACVVDRIEGSKTQNLNARKLADLSAAKPCKPAE
jgi:hypothetical protein